MSTEPTPDLAALTAELADARAAADHWTRMFAAVVRATGPTLVHPGDYAAVDPSGLDTLQVAIPGYPDPATMVVLPEHAQAFVGGMMTALSAGLPDGFTLPDPSTFPGADPDGTPDDSPDAADG